MKTTICCIAILVALGGSALAAQSSTPDLPTLKKMTARYAPVDINVDVAYLPENEQHALAKLIEAARIMDGLYLRQRWGGNPSMLMGLLADETPLGKARLRYFMINKGPWSVLDRDAAFIPGAPAAPPQGNFYPEGATKEEVETWLTGLPAAERKHGAGFYTTIRRMPNGKLTYVPYSVEYQGELEAAGKLLRQAAELTTNDSLKSFLVARAEAFRSSDYVPSDLAWMKIDASLEPTIGPYETYGDEWLNAKAAFEAFIGVRDDEETEKLQVFAAQLQEIENNLPIDPKLRNAKLGAMAPIRVVNVVFTAGDAAHGVQTAAYNLPNDERVTKEHGTKRVMLKNIQEAKFKKVLQPISRVALAPADRKNVTFEAFFTHILMHELLHGLGPGAITVNGAATTVREQLQDTYGAIEEAKADIGGLFAMQLLIDKGVIDESMEKAMYTTYLASTIRSIRFGVDEAHGKGVAVQLNHLLDEGAVKVAKNGAFSVDAAKMKEAVGSLTGTLMTLQANGDRAGAAALLERLGVVRPEVQKVLDKLKNVPVDIEPRFITATKLVAKHAGASATAGGTAAR